jgi:hypothetical protein
MMRRHLTKLKLVATCGSLALLSGCAAGAGGAKALSARTAGDPRPPLTRTWTLTLSAAPEDLALAQISFRGAAPGARVTGVSLRIALSGPFGDDYLVASAVRLPGPARALVVLVNRPSPLLEPVAVHIRVSASRALGTPVVSKLSNPFARRAGAPAPSLCDLPLHGGALAAWQLHALRSRGEPLTGYAGTSAVAQAYDAVCSLPFASSFEQAVTHPAVSTPPVPSPAPTPAPPVGKLPGEGCVPKPGYACPGAVEGSHAASSVGGQRRAAAGAH